MAGFQSPLFLLGLGSGSERAGFRSPLPVPPVGVPSTEQQAGFRSPLPIPPLGADATQRAGYATPLPIYGLWAGDPIDPPDPEPVRIRGGGYAARLHAEDEEILAVIIAASKRRRNGFTGE